MRLVTWNCFRGAVHERVERLRPLRPDIVVLQECSRPSLLDDALWCGPNDRQGVAISLVNPAYQMTRIDDADYADGPGIIVDVEGPTQFTLAGVWTREDFPRTYEQHLRDWLREHREVLTRHPLVVAGDFNLSPAAPRQQLAHQEMVQRLHAHFGMVSANHEFFCAEYGAERDATHYWRWNEMNRWHVDYCFVPREWAGRIRDVQVGTFSDWRDSDHRPLLVDIDI